MATAPADAPTLAEVELHRSDPNEPGIIRRRHGRGFRYLDENGKPVTEPEVRDRIRALVIPPAWTDVWICLSPYGHIQAVGTDAAGRRQYRYHDAWRAQQDAEKFARVLEFAARLPRVRERLGADMTERGLTRRRVLATAVRLLDLGFFRIGGEEYAEDNGTYGLATLRREHVTLHRSGAITFSYLAKGDQQREQAVVDRDVYRVLAALKRRRGGGDELLAYQVGRQWRDVRSDDVNGYLREIAAADADDAEVTAKDFRTWHATVLAAVGLAISTEAPDSEAARKRAVTRVVQEVASYLGNTPAVCRSSYIDPRVIEAYEQGRTIAGTLHRLGEVRYGQLATHGEIERAVVRLIRARSRPKSSRSKSSRSRSGSRSRSRS
jgi:DNA topoisomerase IB